ncbi:MAG: UDP-N-acetyl-D-glucosamine dehydrogenase [Actinobacteria bacterium]|nr:UDP-N-acetyl-D-glucosamine dehydrogenase [Actinomycetota bacterium]
MKAEKFSASAIRKADCVVLIADHDKFDYRMVARESKVVVDTRNALKGHTGPNIIKL